MAVYCSALRCVFVCRMCLVRMRQEGRAGKFMCRYIVYSMWEDVEQRSMILGVRGGGEWWIWKQPFLSFHGLQKEQANNT